MATERGGLDDESLHSRQVLTHGADAQARLTASRVLVYGCRGTGVEIAKNLILMGCSVSLWDPGVVEPYDLSSNYFLRENDVGCPRDASVLPRLAALNPKLKVELAYELHPAAYSVVICADASLVEALRVGADCRAAARPVSCEEEGHAPLGCATAFILAESYGLTGRLFVDGGPSFHVDKDTVDVPAPSPVCTLELLEEGREPAAAVSFRVTVPPEAPHSLSDGDMVTFMSTSGPGVRLSAAAHEVALPALLCDAERGMTVTAVTSPTVFTCAMPSPTPPDVVASIKACLPLGQAVAVTGWQAMKARRSFHLRFRPLASMVGDVVVTLSGRGRPSSGENDMQVEGSLEEEGPTEQDLQCLDPSAGEAGAGGAAGGLSAAEDDSPTATNGHQTWSWSPSQLHHLYRTVIHGAGASHTTSGAAAAAFAASACPPAQLAPVVSVVGGLAAQEAVKLITRVGMPIRQWLYADFSQVMGVLPRAGGTDQVAPRLPPPPRLAGQVAVLGPSMQAALANTSLLLVGAGAIGCEMLKNWALMGIASSDASTQGSSPATVTVTDMDTIEVSNLSRQFLFRAADVGRPKSVVAVEEVLSACPAACIAARQSKVGPGERERAAFPDSFWGSLTGVCTALDNVESRLYVDSQCIAHGLPMYDAGTRGLQGSTMVVVPCLTENYGASTDPADPTFPVCTVKHFPYLTQHVVHWAVDWFYGAFTDAEGSEVEVPVPPAQACIGWAVAQFQANYRDEPAALLEKHPPGLITPEGLPFWSGAKRPPRPMPFDPADPLHAAFILAAVRLVAATCHLSLGEQDAAAILGAAAGLAAASAADGGATLAQYRAQVQAARRNPIAFDRDTSQHLDALVAASNLRARLYGLPLADRLTIQGIAGRIIPAVATTTSVMAGLLCIEMYKVVAHRWLEAQARRTAAGTGGSAVAPASEQPQTLPLLSCLRNYYTNLALPFFAASEPAPCATTTVTLPAATCHAQLPGSAVLDGPLIRWSWSAWDAIHLPGPMTLKGFIDYFKAEWGAVPVDIAYGAVSIYYTDPDEAAKRAAGVAPNVLPPAVRRERAPMTMSALATKLAGQALPPGCSTLTFTVLLAGLTNFPPVRYTLSPEEVAAAAAPGAA